MVRMFTKLEESRLTPIAILSWSVDLLRTVTSRYHLHSVGKTAPGCISRTSASAAHRQIVQKMHPISPENEAFSIMMDPVLVGSIYGTPTNRKRSAPQSRLLELIL